MTASAPGEVPSNATSSRSKKPASTMLLFVASNSGPSFLQWPHHGAYSSRKTSGVALTTTSYVSAVTCRTPVGVTT